MSQAQAADKFKVGFISTMSGVNASVGEDMRDGFDLFLRQRGGKLGGLPVEVIVRDDEAKPDHARQVAERFISNDKVDVVVGVLASNILLSIAKPLLDSKTFLISMGAGPSALAGKRCHPYFFAMSWQNDSLAEAVGSYLNKAKTDSVFAISPDFPAGRDMIAGLKRGYPSPLASETYTQFRQTDYSNEITQVASAKPKSVFFFLSAGPAVAFIKQFKQAGLDKNIAAYSPTLDETILPGLGKDAIGVHTTSTWTATMPDAKNVAFVKAFKEQFKRLPSVWAANAYDTASLLDAAISQVKGKVEDKAAFRKALETVKFDSLRGNFKFNNNHYPIQDYYMSQGAENSEGEPVFVIREKVLSNYGDVYAVECKMPAD